MASPQYLFRRLLSLPSEDAGAVLKAITDQKRWRKIMAEPVDREAKHLAAVQMRMRDYWSIAGHHIREQVGNDVQLAQFLRTWLPPYAGDAIPLFRGEKAVDWDRKRVGFSWTAEHETAEMFARGLKAMTCDGVLLSVLAVPSAIISGPGRHSKWLGEVEHVIDPTALHEIVEVDRYPRHA